VEGMGLSMKNHTKFTKAFVLEIATEKARERFYDTVVDGLVLSVTKGGNKSYYVKFWRADAVGDGCHVERVIGQAKDLTVDEARRKVRELKSEFIEEDPRKSWRKKAVTLQDLHQRWALDIEHKVKVGKVNSRYVANTLRLWEMHMPSKMARRRADEVGVDEFTELFMGLRESSESVHNKIAKHCKSLYKIARERLGVDLGNPLARYTVDKDVIRERFLTVDEMTSLFDALSKEKQIYQDLVMALLLTGQRKSAVLSMSWADLDFKGRTWRIPKEVMKGRSSGHVVPIAKALIDVLERRKQDGDGSVFVFPAQRGKGNGHVTVGGGKTTWWGKAKLRSGLTDIRLHDLRRTMGSWLAIEGVDIYKISKVLAHKDVRVTQEVYAHLKAVDAREDIDRVVGKRVDDLNRVGSVEKTAAVDVESLAANMSGEDKVKMISALARSMT